MNDKNKEDAIAVLDNIEDEYCTNIWDGLKLGMDTLLKKKIPSNN